MEEYNPPQVCFQSRHLRPSSNSLGQRSSLSVVRPSEAWYGVKSRSQWSGTGGSGSLEQGDTSVSSRSVDPAASLTGRGQTIAEQRSAADSTSDLLQKVMLCCSSQNLANGPRPDPERAPADPRRRSRPEDQSPARPKHRRSRWSLFSSQNAVNLPDEGSSETARPRRSSFSGLRRLSRSPKRRDRAVSMTLVDKLGRTEQGNNGGDVWESPGGARLSGDTWHQAANTKRSSSPSPRRVEFTPETKGYVSRSTPNISSIMNGEKAMRPPRIEGASLASPITVRDGDPCDVTVEVAGIPIPDITWFFGSREIKNCPDFRVDDKGTSCTLYIASASEELTTRGLRVVARNRLGVQEQKVDIKVYKIHSRWRSNVKSESFSTKSPDTIIRSKRRRIRKTNSGISMTSLNRTSQTKPTRSMSVGENWYYGNASHSTDSILDEVFSFDRKSAFATSTPRDPQETGNADRRSHPTGNGVLPQQYDHQHQKQQAQPQRSEIHPNNHQHPHGQHQKQLLRHQHQHHHHHHHHHHHQPHHHQPQQQHPPRQRHSHQDVRVTMETAPSSSKRHSTGSAENPSRFRSSESDFKHILVTQAPPLALPEVFDDVSDSATSSPGLEEKVLTPKFADDHLTPVRVELVRDAMDGGAGGPPRPRDPATDKDHRKFSANGQVWISEKKHWKSLSAVPDHHHSSGALVNARYMPANQERWASNAKAQRQPHPGSHRPLATEESVKQKLYRSTRPVPAPEASTEPGVQTIIKRRAATVPKKTRPVSETNLDDFVIPGDKKDQEVASQGKEEEEKQQQQQTKVVVTEELLAPVKSTTVTQTRPASALPRHTRTSGHTTNGLGRDTSATLILTTTIDSREQVQANGPQKVPEDVSFHPEKDSSVALTGLSGKSVKSEVTQSKEVSQVRTTKETHLALEGPTFHPSANSPAGALKESNPEKLTSSEVSEVLRRASNLQANLSDPGGGKRDSKQGRGTNAVDSGLRWVYPEGSGVKHAIQDVKAANHTPSSDVNRGENIVLTITHTRPNIKPSDHKQTPKQEKTSDCSSSQLPCVRNLDEAISMIYAEAFSHFGDSVQEVSTPLADKAKAVQKKKETKVVGAMRENPSAIREKVLTSRPPRPPSTGKTAGSRIPTPKPRKGVSVTKKAAINKEPESLDDTNGPGAPDLLNGINTNGNNHHTFVDIGMDDYEENGYSAFEVDEDVIGLEHQVLCQEAFKDFNDRSNQSAYTSDQCLPASVNNNNNGEISFHDPDTKTMKSDQFDIGMPSDSNAAHGTALATTTKDTAITGADPLYLQENERHYRKISETPVTDEKTDRSEIPNDTANTGLAQQESELSNDMKVTCTTMECDSEGEGQTAQIGPDEEDDNFDSDDTESVSTVIEVTDQERLLAAHVIDSSENDDKSADVEEIAVALIAEVIENSLVIVRGKQPGRRPVRQGDETSGAGMVDPAEMDTRGDYCVDINGQIPEMHSKYIDSLVRNIMDGAMVQMAEMSGRKEAAQAQENNVETTKVDHNTPLEDLSGSTMRQVYSNISKEENPIEHALSPYVIEAVSSWVEDVISSAVTISASYTGRIDKVHKTVDTSPLEGTYYSQECQTKERLLDTQADAGHDDGGLGDVESMVVKEMIYPQNVEPEQQFQYSEEVQNVSGLPVEALQHELAAGRSGRDELYQEEAIQYSLGENDQETGANVEQRTTDKRTRALHVMDPDPNILTESGTCPTESADTYQQMISNVERDNTHTKFVEAVQDYVEEIVRNAMADVKADNSNYGEEVLMASEPDMVYHNGLENASISYDGFTIINRRSSLSSISECSESEEDSSQIHSPEAVTLVTETFTQVDMPSYTLPPTQNRARNKSERFDISHNNNSDRHQEGNSTRLCADASTDGTVKDVDKAATGLKSDQIMTSQEVDKPVTSTGPTFMLTSVELDADLSPFEEQGVIQPVRNTELLHPVYDASDRSITDENSLDLSWDSDMGDLSFAPHPHTTSSSGSTDHQRELQIKQTYREEALQPEEEEKRQPEAGTMEPPPLSTDKVTQETTKQELFLTVTPEVTKERENAANASQNNEDSFSGRASIAQEPAEPLAGGIDKTELLKASITNVALLQEVENNGKNHTGSSSAEEAPQQSVISSFGNPLRELLVGTWGTLFFLLLAIAVMWTISWGTVTEKIFSKKEI